MSLKMSVYYATPDDADGFESSYLERHLPLTKTYPNIKHTSFHKVSRTLMGEFEYSYVFTGTWDDKDSWKADMGSPANEEVAADSETYGVDKTVVVYEQLG